MRKGKDGNRKRLLCDGLKGRGRMGWGKWDGLFNGRGKGKKGREWRGDGNEGVKGYGGRRKEMEKVEKE